MEKLHIGNNEGDQLDVLYIAFCEGDSIQRLLGFQHPLNE